MTQAELIDAFRAHSTGPKIQEFLALLAEEVSLRASDDADTFQGHDYNYFMWANERDLFNTTIANCLNKKKTSITKING